MRLVVLGDGCRSSCWLLRVPSAGDGRRRPRRGCASCRGGVLEADAAGDGGEDRVVAPRPVPGPARNVMPRWRTMIEPAGTSWPSPALTPRRWPTLSRPFLRARACLLVGHRVTRPFLVVGVGRLAAGCRSRVRRPRRCRPLGAAASPASSSRCGRVLRRRGSARGLAVVLVAASVAGVAAASTAPSTVVVATRLGRLVGCRGIRRALARRASARRPRRSAAAAAAARRAWRRAPGRRRPAPRRPAARPRARLALRSRSSVGRLLGGARAAQRDVRDAQDRQLRADALLDARAGLGLVLEHDDLVAARLAHAPRR